MIERQTPRVLYMSYCFFVSALNAILLSSLWATSNSAAGAASAASVSKSCSSPGATSNAQHGPNYPGSGVITATVAIVIAITVAFTVSGAFVESEFVDIYDGADTAKLYYRAFSTWFGSWQYGGATCECGYWANISDNGWSRRFCSRYVDFNIRYRLRSGAKSCDVLGKFFTWIFSRVKFCTCFTIS